MQTRKTTFLATIVALFALAVVRPAQAQEGGPDYIPPSAEGLEKGTKAGWHPLLKLSANFATGQSQDVPGNPDGVSFQLGHIVNGEINYMSESEEHEWVNALLWQLGHTRTPVVDAFIKSVDTIDLKSTYLYHIPGLSWFGPFVAFRLTAPMLAGYEVRAEDSNVLRMDVGEQLTVDPASGNPVDEAGNVIDPTDRRVELFGSGRKIDLTGAFAPLTLRESAGLFAIPVDQTVFRLDFRLGFGAWETFVGDGYVVEDNDETTDIFELRALQDSVQAGPEFGVAIKGIVEERMTYNASALLMQPVAHSADTDLEGFELLNAEFEGVLGIKAWEFLSIDYSFKYYRQPLIVDAWQIQNNIMLSLNFEIIGVKPPEPECPPCECPPAREKPTEEKPTQEKPVTDASEEGAVQPTAPQGEDAAVAPDEPAEQPSAGAAGQPAESGAEPAQPAADTHTPAQPQEPAEPAEEPTE